MELGLDSGKRVKHELRNVGERSGFVAGNAILSERSEKLTEDEVDVGTGHEAAGQRGGELDAEAAGFQGLLLFAGVEGAESGMASGTEHAAAAAVESNVAAAVEALSSETRVLVRGHKTPLVCGVYRI